MGYFDCAFARIAGRFKRVETRMAARDWLLGVLSDVDTRSCWQLAERAGHASPHRMQRLLAGGGVGRRRGPPDEFYGNHRGLRRDLQARTLGYVLGVASNHRLTLATGLSATAEHIAARHLPRRSWTGYRPARATRANATTTGPSYASSRPPTRPPATTGC
jgi:hypothetical protein